MTTPARQPDAGSILPPLLALAAIGLGYCWASWSAREAGLTDRTRARLA